MGIREVIKQKLIAFQEKKYHAKLSKKKMTYEQWIARMVCHEAGQLVQSQIVLLQTGEGTLAAGAEAQIEAFMAQHPQVLIAYGDEDVMDPVTGERRDPWFKPDWSPDTLLSCFYWGSVVAVRRDWLLEIGEAEGSDEQASDPNAGRMSRRQLMELLAKLAVKAGGFERDCKAIAHIPGILFHAVSCEQREEYGIWTEADVSREDAMCEDVSLRDAAPRMKNLISVIIPSKDHPEILIRGLKAFFATRGACKCEIIVVDNGSSEDNRQRVEQFLQSAPVPCEYIYQPMEFNFSGMCNLGAERAKGELLLFLNDDVEAACPGWLEQMARKAMQTYAGAVGLKLYYPGSNRMQHDGIVNLPMGPVHKLQFLTDDQTYYDQFNKINRNVLAVTGACLMVHRDKFAQAGGMNESLRVAFNDVDLCFQLWELGYHNVMINSAYAYHHESLSRGDDESGEKLGRLMAEKERLYRLHPELEGKDPYYPAGLNRDSLDTVIRPAYMTAGNRIQEARFQEVTVDLKQYRRDDCLLFRLERCEPRCIQGYSVVLGDNNACYDKKLILWKIADRHEQQDAGNEQPEKTIRCLCVSLEEQYRPDLEENMPDQINVALCGLWVKPEQPTRIREGVYRPGIIAISRTGGTRLINWSNRVLKVSPGANRDEVGE